MLIPDETGLLAQRSNPESVAAKLSVLAADRELRRRMGRAGRERAFALFDERTMHQAYDQIYRSMLGINGQPINARAAR